VDAQTLTTAIAVNMGLITVSSLEEVSKDDELEAFKKVMIDAKALTPLEASRLRAFYDPIYAPMTPTYCMIYPDRLPEIKSVFNVGDDDSRFASFGDALISDDQVPFAGNPTEKPTFSPTANSSPVSATYYLVFGLVYAPFDASKIRDNYYCYYLNSSHPCPEFNYLESSVKVYQSVTKFK